MPTLDEVLAEEIAKIEPEVVDDTKIAEDSGSETPVVPEDNEGEPDKPSEPETPADDGADVAPDDAEVDEPFVPEPITPVLPELPADVQTFVNEKLTDVEVWGRKGEEGKIEKFTVKSAYDLPDDFIPRSYKDQQIQAQQFAAQDRKTANLEAQYYSDQETRQQNEQQRALEASWAVELKAAQDAGRIPVVKKEVPTDPGYQKAAEVIEYMKQENTKLANFGAPYRIQSFTQALDLYEANGLKTAQVEAVTKEDALKSKKGSMVGGGRPSKDAFNALPAAGTKLEDLLSGLTA